MSTYFIPTTLSKYHINDVFYSDTGRLTVIMYGVLFQPKIHFVDLNTNQRFELDKNVYKDITTYHGECVYTLNHNIVDKPCDIQLVINEEIVCVHVNSYPQFPGEIIMSTLVKNEDKYLKQWIDYYLRLGITRFIIYDNAHSMSLAQLLHEYIEKQIVILIKWSYNYVGENAQMTQQNHSIYAFQTSKYIGLLDVDEYINIQKKIKIGDYFNELIESKNIDINQSSGFQFANRFFYNPDNLPTDDLDFFQCFECDNLYIGGRQKCFVIPTNVKTFLIHTVAEGLPLYEIHGDDAFFNHYFFLNKYGRGRNRTGMTNNSILLHLQ
jgi:hypothetical protein